MPPCIGAPHRSTAENGNEAAHHSPSVRALLMAGILLLVSVSGCFDLGGQSGIRPTDYIRDGEYSRWVVEIDHVQGQRPRDSALSILQDRMDDLVHKDRITVKIGETFDGRNTWSDDAIQSLSADRLTEETSGDRIVTHVLYLDGEYGPNRDVLGVAYGHGLVAIFKERIDTGCSLVTLCIGNAGTVETAVLVHEFGHIIGLVDRGVDMVNDHSDGGRHSDNENSVMWAGVRNTGIFGVGDNIPTRFDANDRLDICAAGGKGSC